MGLTNVFTFSIYVSNIYYLTNKNLFNKSQLFVKETYKDGLGELGSLVSIKVQQGLVDFI